MSISIDKASLTAPAPKTAVGPACGIAFSSFAYFFFLGTATPYFSLWLAQKGLESHWIAAIATALLIGATMGQALLPYAAVRIGRGPAFVITALGALGCTAALMAAPSPGALLGVALIGALFTGAAIPLIDAIALEIASPWYGRIRAAGSVGFAMATLGVGWLIDRWGVGCVLPIEVAALLALLLGALAIARGLAPMAEQPSPRETAQSIAPLRSASLWAVMLSVALINAGHAYYYTFSNLHWSRDLGYSSATLGLLWATGVVAEISIFSCFGDSGDAAGARRLILLGALGGLLRWAATACDPPLALLFALQLLHGLSFAAALLGGLRMVKAMVPDDVAPVAIGVFAALVHGVVIGVVTALLGMPFARDPALSYLFMAGLCGTGGLLALLLPLFRAPDPLPA
jgi:PPP family 3-phenylpropionic acid transporter